MALGYKAMYNAQKPGFKACGIRCTAVTHAPRKSAARILLDHGLPKDDIKGLGKWEQKSCELSYIDRPSLSALLTAANHTSPGHQYYLGRGEVEVPLELLEQTQWYWDVQEMKKHYKESGNEEIAAHNVIGWLEEMLHWFFQDAAIKKPRLEKLHGGTHVIYKHWVFNKKNPKYKIWENFMLKVQRVHTEVLAQKPPPHACNMGAVAMEMHHLQAYMRESDTLLQARLQQQLQQFAQLLSTQSSLGTSMQPLCSQPQPQHITQQPVPSHPGRAMQPLASRVVSVSQASAAAAVQPMLQPTRVVPVVARLHSRTGVMPSWDPDVIPPGQSTTLAATTSASRTGFLGALTAELQHNQGSQCTETAVASGPPPTKGQGKVPPALEGAEHAAALRFLEQVLDEGDGFKRLFGVGRTSFLEIWRIYHNGPRGDEVWTQQKLDAKYGKKWHNLKFMKLRTNADFMRKVVQEVKSRATTMQAANSNITHAAAANAALKAADADFACQKEKGVSRFTQYINSICRTSRQPSGELGDGGTA